MVAIPKGLEVEAVVTTLPLESRGALKKSMAHFARSSGPDLLARTEAFLQWQDVRREIDVWPFSRSIDGPPGPTSRVRNEAGKSLEGINFASTDYLGLSTHPAIQEAAIQAIRDYGPHSPSSPMLQGNTGISLQLEEALTQLVGMEHILLFSTGWGAGFGAIAGLVRANDHIVMDNLAHACLQAGAMAATQNIRRHAHLDVEAVQQHLQEIRSVDTKNAILVVSEGLFSMDSDWPNLERLQAVCHEYEATLLVDVAHDLGSTGPNGTGQIGVQNLVGKIDLVMGAFSKSFATNGGFLATRSHAVKQFVRAFGGPHIFSTALSPVQAGVALEAVRIIRSPEGEVLRSHLMRAVQRLRQEFASNGITCMGDPSPIVPVPIGNEKVARLACPLIFDNRVFANLIEFPAVAVGSARFRMQVMATHTDEQIQQSARIVANAIQAAKDLLYAPKGVFAVVETR